MDPTGLSAQLAIGIAGNLASSLIAAVAGKVRRRFTGDPERRALEAALAEALDGALGRLPLAPALRDHCEDIFRTFFTDEEVAAELALLLDPRPDVSPDLGLLTNKLEEAGLDPSTLPDLDLGAFLLDLARGLWAAAGKDEHLRAAMQLKLLGEMVIANQRVAALAERTVMATERTASASERTADGVEQLTGEFRELKLSLTALVAGSLPAERFLALVREAGSGGLVPAFAAFLALTEAAHSSGLDLVVADDAGRIELAGTEQALPPARQALLTAATELWRAIVEREPSAAELDALEERYRLHLVRWFEHLTFQGLMRSPKPIVLPLEEVYVELRAVAEVPEAADAFTAEERRLLVEAEESEEREGRDRRELLARLDEMRRERWSRSFPERVSIGGALTGPDRQAVVVLGDPGSGKTTLLRFLALVHARGADTAAARLGIDRSEAGRLPIFVPLAAFDDMLRGRQGLMLAEFLPRYYERRRGLPGLAPLFRRALESGRALVLLDGLDEVLDAGTRRYVAQQVGALVAEWVPRGVRFVVSSRFVGYREAPVPGSPVTLSVLDFGETEIRTFIRQWARAYERWAAGGEDNPEIARRAQELESGLMNDVKSNESVRRLAANPLLLTMLALLRRQVGRLPHRRVQLYESYVGTLLENWIEMRSEGARERAVDDLDRLEAENLLLPFALWLQREKPSGTAGRTEVEQMLAATCLRERGLEPDKAPREAVREAEEQAARFLHEMRELTGLIVERGHDAFGFLHLTFQEYFAGRALAAMPDEERKKVLLPHLHDPRWREPILLCAGRLGVVENRRSQATTLVRWILEHEDDTEPYLHRNLLLALTVAGDDVNLEPALIDNLVERALEVLPSKILTLDQDLFNRLAQLVVNGTADLERCFGWTWKAEHKSSRAAGVTALGRFVVLPAIQTEMLRGLTDKNEAVQKAAASALSGLAESETQVRAALLQLLESSEGGGPRAAAIYGLAKLVGKDDVVRRAVMSRLSSTNYEEREALAEVLGPILEMDLEIRAAWLENFAESWLTPSEERVLSSLASSSFVVRPIVLKVIQHDAILTGSRLLRGDVEIKRFLIAGIREGKLGAVATSSALLAEDEDIRDAVIEIIRDQNIRDTIRSLAVAALRDVVDKDERAAGAIRALMRDPSWRVRMAVALVIVYVAWPDRLELLRTIAFPKIYNASGRNRGRRSRWLKNAAPARLIAASALINQEEDVTACIEICFEALARRYDKQDIRYTFGPSQAVAMLGSLERLEYLPRVTERLIETMQQDKSNDLRDAAYGALLRLTQTRERARMVS